MNPIGIRSCYDEGKRCAETLFFDYHRQHRLDIRVARIFNTYGPRMHPNDGRVVSNFVVQALRGEPITIFGEGSQTRSFCYVDDLVAAIIAFMHGDNDFPGPINLGNPSEVTIRELAETIIRLTNSTSHIEFGRSQATIRKDAVRISAWPGTARMAADDQPGRRSAQSHRLFRQAWRRWRSRA